MSETIKVLYCCDECGIVDRAVAVPVRVSQQNVVQWLEGVVAVHIARDHRLQSPQSRSKVDRAWAVRWSTEMPTVRASFSDYGKKTSILRRFVAAARAMGRRRS